MLILLDIDGVMVPANLWKRPEFLSDGFPEFSSRATKALQKLISATSADILLTTSHKSTYSINEWKEIFKLRGIEINDIECLPTAIVGQNRKDEVMAWLNTQPLSEFIIIEDDKSLNGLPDHIKSKLIQTSGTIGLTEDLVKTL